MSFLKMSYIGKYTFIEIYKSKIMINIMAAGFFLLVACYVASDFSYGNPSKIALDVGLGLLSITTKILALFFGVSLLKNEIESRTIYLILSNPVSRMEFLVGKVFGLCGILLLNTVILGCFTTVLYYVWDGVWTSLILWSIAQVFLESIMILLLVVTFSLVTNVNLSIFYTIGLYVVGSVISTVVKYEYIQKGSVLSSFVKTLSFIIPNFSIFDVKSFILYQETVSLKYLVMTFGYGIVYSLLLLTTSVLILNSKDLD